MAHVVPLDACVGRGGRCLTRSSLRLIRRSSETGLLGQTPEAAPQCPQLGLLRLGVALHPVPPFCAVHGARCHVSRKLLSVCTGPVLICSVEEPPVSSCGAISRRCGLPGARKCMEVLYARVNHGLAFGSAAPQRPLNPKCSRGAPVQFYQE